MTVSRFRTTIRCDHPGGCDAWWGVGVGETMQDICTMHGREVSGR